MKLTDVDFAVEASGMVRAFNQAGVLDVSDVHVAQRLCALAGESDERVALAVAVAVRALRAGSVCVDLLSIARVAGHDDLPWPDPADWLAAVRASPLLADPPVLHLYDDRLLYLDRYWREDEQVCADLLALLTSRRPAGVPDLRRLFPTGFDEQRRAAEIALSQGVTVLTGGPGTGKTTTVARLLALVAEQAELAGEPRPRIALAAPTGKAAARLAEAVRREMAKLDATDRARLGDLHAVTLHRLLGAKPGARFRQDRQNRLPHNVIVVDETSMVSLTLMARLAEAVRPGARLILVGDADQLASVEAGAVLADLVDGFSVRDDALVAQLRTSHRFGKVIGTLAEAIRPAMAMPYWACCARVRSGSSSSTTRIRRRGCARCWCHTRCGCARRRCWVPPTSRWPPWTSTGCCVRIGTGPPACCTGTAGFKPGSPRRPASRPGRRGTPGVRCW